MQYKNVCIHKHELPRWLSGKEHTGDAGDAGLIPGLGRCPGGENDNPLKYMNLSKLWETVEDRGAWHAAVPVDFRTFWCFQHSDDLRCSLDWTETNRTF